ncbi:hypothetical protein LNP24_28865 [Klebsiella pneumoniae subsp. pneumoniae]|nr:hypothetical protein [Klebsiella pneumoniae subsp. pneumoniae]
MRFSKSDLERGYVANSIWEVQSVAGDSVTLSDGKTTRTLTPKADQAQQHIDLAYAITAHGAQGASGTVCHRAGRGGRWSGTDGQL